MNIKKAPKKAKQLKGCGAKLEGFRTVYAGASQLPAYMDWDL